jgi:hypothetical protein
MKIEINRIKLVSLDVLQGQSLFWDTDDSNEQLVTFVTPIKLEQWLLVNAALVKCPCVV